MYNWNVGSWNLVYSDVTGVIPFQWRVSQEKQVAAIECCNIIIIYFWLINATVS